MSTPIRLIISGGGTGGHIYPAVSIASEIRRRFPDAAILFVGALGKMEMEKVPKAGYEIEGLAIAGINRSNLLANLGFPIKLLKSLLKARKIVKSFKPDVVVGVGGYASGPTLLAANFLGIKTFLQEQNSYAGITNKNLAKKAAKICVAYPGMEAFFPKEKIIFTGNPVRADIANIQITKSAALEHFGLASTRATLLIIGGSQGALSINKAIAENIKKITDAQYNVIWQTGKGFLDKAQAAVATLAKDQVYAADFIYEMDKVYAAADCVISRAGALSVSELCLVAKPSILVPFPNAAEDHQTKNAMSLVNHQAALLVKDEAAAQNLVDTALSLLADKTLQASLSQAIKLLAKPNAAAEIVDQILSIVKK